MRDRPIGDARIFCFRSPPIRRGDGKVASLPSRRFNPGLAAIAIFWHNQASLKSFPAARFVSCTVML
jgi:hypothetical protein